MSGGAGFLLYEPPAAAAPVIGWMEGSESGALVPSDSIMEVETWVKLSNFPAEFLTAEDIRWIVSSFGSPVATDEDTFEKVENHKRSPKLRRKLHSRKTFVTILVRVCVTKPLPSLVAVGSKIGREYIIRLDFDPTPKVCLLCLGAGHFDFECCGTDKESVEIIAEAGVGFDGFCADLHGEQGAATTDGLHSYEDSTVVEAALMVDSHILPAASSVIGAAAAPDLMPLLPATDYGVQGTLISDGVTFEDATVVEAMNCPAAICDVGDAIVDPCIVDEQLSGVFHKWRDFTDDQGLSEDGSGTGVGLLDVEVQDFSPVVEDDLVENFLNIEQLFSVVNNPRKHHKWRDKSVVLGLWCVTLDEQGMFSFGKLDLLQMLSRLVWNLAATYYEQVCFKIHHKWRDKGY